MHTVASPDPNSRGGSQLPNPNECSSTLTNGTGYIYPYPHIRILMSAVTVYEIRVTAYVFSTRPAEVLVFEVLAFEVLVFDLLKFFIYKKTFSTF